MRVRQRTLLNNKDKKSLIAKLVEQYGESVQSVFDKKDQMEYVRLESREEVYLINETPAILLSSNPDFGTDKKEVAIPMLNFLANNDFPIKYVVVDAGAIKFISSGADVMRPGIVEIDPNIKKDEFIAIKEINHKKTLAIGIALFDGQEMQSMDSGKVVKSIHHVGDLYYNIGKDL